MDRANLTEIRKGQTGTGLLIENVGTISLDDNYNKTLMESIRLNEDVSKEFFCPKPFIVSALFQRYGALNSNGRIYPESILRREVDRFQKKIDDKRALMELNHPDEASIDLGRVAANIIELHWEGCNLIGKMEILVTEGFRKHGICSTLGDQTANLLLNGIKIGVSSRGLGTVEKKMDKLIVCDDYEIVCWDIVSDPSTHGSWITNTDAELKPYMESVNHSSKSKLMENMDKFSGWLRIND